MAPVDPGAERQHSEVIPFKERHLTALNKGLSGDHRIDRLLSRAIAIVR
jgi:hypothetical protein